MKKKTILIVPPHGAKIKAFRVRLSVAVMLLILSLGGLAGFFVPQNTFTLDEVEQNQKRNIAEQNKKLLERILSTLRLLNTLKEQVHKLESKRDSVARKDLSERKKVGLSKRVDLRNMTPDALLLFVEKRHQHLVSLTSHISSERNIFTSLPVILPVPPGSPLTRHFGMCKDPFTGKQKMHYGVDFVAEPGTPVFATADGTVARVENHPLWGRRVVLNHENGFRTVYAHLGSVKPTQQGRVIKRGEVLGTIGLSGLTSGPHVHYEIWRAGSAVDPEEYFYPNRESEESPQITASNN